MKQSGFQLEAHNMELNTKGNRREENIIVNESHGCIDGDNFKTGESEDGVAE